MTSGERGGGRRWQEEVKQGVAPLSIERFLLLPSFSPACRVCCCVVVVDGRAVDDGPEPDCARAAEPADQQSEQSQHAAEPDVDERSAAAATDPGTGKFGSGGSLCTSSWLVYDCGSAGNRKVANSEQIRMGSEHTHTKRLMRLSNYSPKLSFIALSSCDYSPRPLLSEFVRLLR